MSTSATGHEDEFRQLFEQEASSQLDVIQNRAGELVGGAPDPELVKTLFRCAHTLKGTAAIVGFDDIARIARPLEDLFEAVEQGRRPPTPDLIDAVIDAATTMREMIPALMSGEDRSEQAAQTEAFVTAALEGQYDGAIAEAQPAPATAEQPRPAAAADEVLLPGMLLDEAVRLASEAAASQLALARALARGSARADSPALRELSEAIDHLQSASLNARIAMHGLAREAAAHAATRAPSTPPAARVEQAKQPAADLATTPPGRELATEARATAARPTTRRASVLVVDDTVTVRELQRSILTRAGYEVRTAADGEEALQLLTERTADLVLTDVDMPRMDGLALTEAIRSRAPLKALPVIMITSRSGEADRRCGLEAGADEYLSKNAVDEEALLGAIERVLGGAAA